MQAILFTETCFGAHRTFPFQPLVSVFVPKSAYRVLTQDGTVVLLGHPAESQCVIHFRAPFLPVALLHFTTALLPLGSAFLPPSVAEGVVRAI